MKKSHHRMLIGVVTLMGFLLNPLWADEPARLALIVENPDLLMFEDLLTAELSQDDSVFLLERTEIRRILREQGLVPDGFSNADTLKVGQLLRADGLLTLEVVKDDTNSFLNARLIAVKPGVYLDFINVPWPLTDATELSQVLLHRFQPLFPKLRVQVKDAIPISILNLRGAMRTTEYKRVERAMTLLLINRLIREREIFVLERQRMNLLAAEKELYGNDGSPFWNGAFLLEGIIDKHGFATKNITLSARFSPPDGGKPASIEISAPRENLAAVVEELAKKILESLRRDSSASEWNPDEESRQFYEEAQWALKWGLINQAQAAADSAWTLGKRDMDCASVRVKAYLPDVPPKDPFRRYSENGVYRVAANEPELHKLEAAVHILELYYGFSRSLPSEEPIANSPWYVLGNDVLEAASKVLQHFHFVPESRKGVGERLTELRFLARATAQWIGQSPSVRQMYWLGHGERWSWVPNIFERKLTWGCFWQERPEDCVAFYREQMASDIFPHIHKSLWRRAPELPRVTAWNENDRKRVPQIWEEFLRELDESTDEFVRFEAMAMRHGESLQDDQFLSRLDGQYWRRLEDGKRHEANLAAFERQKAYLGNNTPYDFVEFSRTFSFSLYSEAQARELQSLLAAYKTNAAAHAGTDRGRVSAVRFWIENVERNVDRILNPPVATNASSTTSAARASSPPVLSEPEAIPLAPVNALVIRKFFKVPLGGPSSAANMNLFGYRSFGGKLYFELHRPTGRGAEVYSFAAIGNPNDDEWQVIQFPDSTRRYRQSGPEDQSERGLLLQEFDGALYSSEVDGIKRFDFEKRRWKSLNVPVENVARLFVVHDRLFASSDYSIVELLDGGEATRILASRRRRPPASALDSLNGLEKLPLFPGPNGTIRTFVENKIYSWDGNDWVKTSDLRLSGQLSGKSVSFSEGGTIFYDRPSGSQWKLWRLLKNETHPEFCVQSPEAIGTTPTTPPRPAPASTVSPEPLWPDAESLALAEMPVAAADGNLYFFVPRHGSNNMTSAWEVMESDARFASLVCLDRNSSKPLIVPLQIDSEQADGRDSHVDPVSRLSSFSGSSPHFWIAFTPEHLAIGRRDLAGCWLIPKNEMKAAFNRERASLSGEKKTSVENRQRD